MWNLIFTRQGTNALLLPPISPISPMNYNICFSHHERYNLHIYVPRHMRKTLSETSNSPSTDCLQHHLSPPSPPIIGVSSPSHAFHRPSFVVNAVPVIIATASRPLLALRPALAFHGFFSIASRRDVMNTIGTPADIQPARICSCVYGLPMLGESRAGIML